MVDNTQITNSRPFEDYFLNTINRNALDNKVDFSPVQNACTSLGLPIFIWDEHSTQFDLIVPVPSDMIEELQDASNLAATGVSVKLERIANNDGESLPVCLVGRKIPPVEGKIFSAYALSRGLHEDKSLLRGAINVFNVVHGIEAVLPTMHRELLAGHECIELDEPSAGTNQLDGVHAHLYRVGGQASLVIPFTEIADSKLKKVLAEVATFLEAHGRSAINISQGSKKAVQVQVDEGFYDDLRNFAEKLNLTIRKPHVPNLVTADDAK